MAIYSGFSQKKIVIFHSYVSLSEGTCLMMFNGFVIVWLSHLNTPMPKKMGVRLGGGAGRQ